CSFRGCVATEFRASDVRARTRSRPRSSSLIALRRRESDAMTAVLSGAKFMREGIHPKYEAAKIVCACGSVIETRSTVPTIHVEICSACHPFFTGKQKLVDTAGRVERFQRKYGLKRSGSGSTPA